MENIGNNNISIVTISYNCKDDLEKKFQQVRTYIQDNPRSSIQEISEANEVTTNQIHKQNYGLI